MAFDALNRRTQSGKFKVMNGQVILIDVEQFNALNAENGGRWTSPSSWVMENWDIGTDFHVQQIRDCMLRGVVEIDPYSPDTVKMPGNSVVMVSEDNLPPHRHHSGITSGSGIETIAASGS